ncbi:MAG: nitrite/sulfite reductase [Nitrospinota bacterium]|nr:MAG: nitrite/sulfite reductase [Nitrospinota bacterium]
MRACDPRMGPGRVFRCKHSGCLEPFEREESMQTQQKGFYQIPREVLDSIPLYRMEVERFQRGEVSPEQFKAFRVPWGVYSQRRGETYMVRVKVPAGGLLPEQLETIARLSARYGDGVVHVTDRQDVQIHGVSLQNTPTVLEELVEVSLTPRGGGGNTIRNITACALAGVCPQEAFDVSPYPIALTEQWLRDPRSYTLPRKFKIAFSGCADDCALATINDLGFIAKTAYQDGRTVQGFTVYVAGGLGAHSRTATLLEPFILAEEVSAVVETLVRLFDRYGDRQNRHRARLRFVMERLGEEQFRAIYREELSRVRAEGPRPLSLRPLPAPPPQVQSMGVNGESGPQRNGDPAFQAWLSTHVLRQRQPGYAAVQIWLPLGNIPAGQLTQLAQVIRRFGEQSVRTTHRQNLILRWVADAELYPLYQALKGIGLTQGQAEGITDILSCPGAATCNLGICLSRGLAQALMQTLEESELPLEELDDIDIRISGCPNACGQHPIGAIGLHGAARRVQDQMVPHYRVLVGGRVAEGKTRLGESCGFVPARKVPDLLRTFLHHYLDTRLPGEAFQDFLDRRGRQDLRQLVQRQGPLPSFREERSIYIDWGAVEQFSLAEIGAGECSEGARDVTEADIGDAQRYLHQATTALEAQDYQTASAALYKALVLGARALLGTQKVHPEDDAAALQLFQRHFVASGSVPARYHNLEREAERMLQEVATEEEWQRRIDYATGLINLVAEQYRQQESLSSARRN